MRLSKGEKRMWRVKRVEERKEGPMHGINKEALGSARALNSLPFPLPPSLFPICSALYIFLCLYHEKPW